MPSSACHAAHRHLHSFPTRRSSDLIGIAECVSQFVAATNGSPIDPDFANACARTTRCGPAPVGAMLPLRRPTGALAGYGQAFHGVKRSEEHTSELQSHVNLVCRLLLATPPTGIYTLSLHDALPI